MATKSTRVHEDGAGLRWEKREGHWQQVCAWTRSGRCTHAQLWVTRLFESGPPAPEHGDHWGHWELDAEVQILVYRGPKRRHYEIDLERARDYMSQAKWLRHMAEKSWLQRGDLDDLAAAMLACDEIPLQRKQGAM